jgi:hypothetical protein
MATLSNPTFQIDILTGMPNDYRVRGTVNVELTPFEMSLINMGLPLQLQSNLWEDDESSEARNGNDPPIGGFGYIGKITGGEDGKDDLLFSFTTQNITAPGTYTFEATVPRNVLNEDASFWAGNNRDEVYNKFSLVSGSNLFPLNIATNSPLIIGLF